MSVVAELRSLYERDGHLTAEQVLAAAADESSPLHSQFVWDDTEAARRYRLEQAGALIRRCKVTIVGSDEQTHRVRAYVHLPAEEGPGRYMPTGEALADPATRNVVIQQAARDVAALRRKYKALIDFDAVLRSELQQDEAKAS